MRNPLHLLVVAALGLASSAVDVSAQSISGGGNLPLPNAEIYVGNVSGIAAPVAMSKDCAIDNAGAITCTKTNGVPLGALATENAITPSQCPLFTVAQPGCVPASSTKYVSGAASSTSGDIALFNGTIGGSIQDAGGGIPSIPLVHPSSGNVIGAGCVTPHVAWWADQNVCSSADTWILNSTDPSALMQLTIDGTITTGDVVTLTFTFGSGACVSGCAVNTGALNSGTDTTTTIASKLVSAIQANSNIYNNVAGAQKQVLYVTSGANVLDFDYDSRVGMKLVATVSGSATETVTFPANSSCGTSCLTGWDVNPSQVFGRLPGSGIAPIANLGLGISSQLYAMIVQSSDSATPNAYSIQYGTLANFVQNSTHGNVQSRWFLGVPSPGGAPGAIGIWIGRHTGYVQDAAPTLTGTCGTGASIQAGATDNAGQINLGTGTASPCNLVFAHSFTATPSCIVTRESGSAGLAYSPGTSQLSTAGGSASDKINYVCYGQ